MTMQQVSVQQSVNRIQQAQARLAQEAQARDIPTATASFESLAAEIAQADSAIKQWTERKDYLRGLLVQLHQAGEAPSKFTAVGKNWSLTDGKKTWTYPAEVQEYEANLKATKVICQKNGTATYEIGEPFYTAREIKSSEAGR